MLSVAFPLNPFGALWEKFLGNKLQHTLPGKIR